MKKSKYKAKRFLFPILSLVLISIILIAVISSYISINMFKSHMQEHIEQTKKEYTKEHKDRVYKEVNFVNGSIEFQISRIEKRLKKSLEEKVEIAINVTNFTYNKYKDTLNKEEIKKKIAEALSIIKFNDSRSYYFMYDNKTKILFAHPMKKFIGRDMTNFRDSRGQSLMQLDAAILKKEKIGFSKIYFNKPDNQEQEFPKITCITKFEPLDLVIGTGEYLDVIEEQIKGHVLTRFSNIQYKNKDKYLVILDIHNLKGGDEFATVLLNANRPELVGNKVSDKDKDVKGNRFRKNFLDLVVNEGDGYLKYWYKKPSTKEPAAKISYFYLQKDWNWIILSGFYYEDLEKQISIMKDSITTHTDNTINKTILWVVFLSFVAILIAIYVSLRIDKTIKKYTNTIIDYENSKREQENLLIQQSKLASMGEMLSNIAHQWRQPLSVISTASTGIKFKNECNLLKENELNDTMTSINNSAQYLSQTIDDFRSFFDPNNSKVKEFSIQEILDKTLKLLETQFKSKNIEIIKDIESNDIESLDNEIIQVLINILNNAKDALEAGEIKDKLVFISSYKKGNSICIEVLDNAGGIKSEIIDRIFEPYFTTKHQFKGTGIGLYMSQDIVKNHLNGTLSVSNKTYTYKEVEYTGANFVIEINLKQ